MRIGVDAGGTFTDFVVLHDDGRLEPDASFYCTSDTEAVARLPPPPREDMRAELWQGGRFIAAAGYLRRLPGERPHAAG